MGATIQYFFVELIYFEEVIVGEIEKESVTAGTFLLSRPVCDKTRVKTLGMRHKGLREHFSTGASLSTAEHLNCLSVFPGFPPQIYLDKTRQHSISQRIRPFWASAMVL